MKKILTGIFSLAFLIGSAGAAKADSLYNFETFDGTTIIPENTPTPLSLTNNGVTASFSSTTADGFIVQSQNQFQGFGGGKNLYQQNPPYNFIPLTVAFSAPEQSTAFNFAINGTADATITLTAFLGGIAVGTPLTVGSTLSNDGFYSFGSLAYSPGVSFDSFVLTSNRDAFALDDLSISPAASGVPEPASFALLLLGCAGVLAIVRHRRIHPGIRP